MNKRGAGVAFCAISAFLFFAKYLFKVALYALEHGNFMIMVERDFLAINLTLNIFNALSVIALIIGGVYLISAEVEEKKKR
jgi:energy-converting hydrogenase Eha subunit C